MSTEKLIPELIVKAFEHHKTHARFEESQRTLFVAAYFTATGVLADGIISAFTFQGKIIAEASKAVIVAILVHMALGIFIAIAVAKVSGEFRRHFKMAEKILLDVAALDQKSQLSSVLRHAALETAGHQKNRLKVNWRSCSPLPPLTILFFRYLLPWTLRRSFFSR
ncbi:MAG TPA: hypothetical protein VFC54_00165 [Pseudolabrys sp.]|nr:hypothetical protein [Pseudolabrys sp.]